MFCLKPTDCCSQRHDHVTIYSIASTTLFLFHECNKHKCLLCSACDNGCSANLKHKRRQVDWRSTGLDDWVDLVLVHSVCLFSCAAVIKSSRFIPLIACGVLFFRQSTFLVRARCFRRQKKTHAPYLIHVTFNGDGRVLGSHCERPKGKNSLSHTQAVLQVSFYCKKMTFMRLQTSCQICHRFGGSLALNL